VTTLPLEDMVVLPGLLMDVVEVFHHIISPEKSQSCAGTTTSYVSEVCKGSESCKLGFLLVQYLSSDNLLSQAQMYATNKWSPSTIHAS